MRRVSGGRYACGKGSGGSGGRWDGLVDIETEAREGINQEGPNSRHESTNTGSVNLTIGKYLKFPR